MYAPLAHAISSYQQRLCCSPEKAGGIGTAEEEREPKSQLNATQVCM